MNVRCPSCQALYRVDPARVPPGGAQARCSRCGNTFAVSVTVPPPPVAAVASAPQAPAPAGVAPSAAAEPPRNATQSRPAPPPPAAPRPAAPATSGAAAAGAPPFTAQDPQGRAHRIARALVSDIVAYNRERRDRALAAGTLRNEFREEIMKSWQEYVEQVGQELAKGTPYFRDSLNEILAQGQPVF